MSGHEKRPVHEGFYWGIVVSTKDPKKRRRIQVRVPDVLGKTISEWADPDSLVLKTLKIGDKVWVRFLHSDLRYPVYHIPHDLETAYLKNDKARLDLTTPDGTMTLRAPTKTAYLSGVSSSVLVGGGTVKCAGKDGAGLVACEATEFIVGSSKTLKRDIADLDFDPLGAVGAASARLWHYRPEHTTDDRRRIGPIAEELPDIARRGNGVDLTSMVGILWAAVGQLAEQAKQQGAEIAALRDELRILKEE